MNQRSTQTARVKYPAGKIFQTKYGERVNAVVGQLNRIEAKLDLQRQEVDF